MDSQTLVLSILVLAAFCPGLARRSADQQPPEAGLVRQASRDRLDADAWIFCDGPVNQSRIQEVVATPPVSEGEPVAMVSRVRR